MEAAWAATHAKGTFLQAKYHALGEADAQAEGLGGDCAPAVSDQLSSAESPGPVCRIGHGPVDQQQVDAPTATVSGAARDLGVKVTLEEGGSGSPKRAIFRAGLRCQAGRRMHCGGGVAVRETNSEPS